MALSPSLTIAVTLCNCGALGGLCPGWLLTLSLTGTYVWTFLLWTLAVPRDWVDFPSPSSHFQDSVSCLTCSHDSQLLRHPAIDIVWRWPCLPRFRLLQTPCYCGVLGGLSVLVGFLTYPSNEWMLWPSWLDTWPDGLPILLLGLGYGIKLHRWVSIVCVSLFPY